MWYNWVMPKRPLIETNPYLRNQDTYEKFLFISVSSSATIELGKLPRAIEEALRTTNYGLIYIPPTEGIASL